MDRIFICESLLKRNEIESFFKRLITGEKWIMYDNNVRKRSWSKQDEAPQTVAKPRLTPRKVMLYVWWDWKGIVHYCCCRSVKQLILTSTINNWKDYVKQSRESDQNQWKRHHLPSRQRQTPHIFDNPSKIERTWLGSFDAFTLQFWLCIIRLSFVSISLNGVKLTSKEARKNHLSQFFAQKSQKFYRWRDGFKWQK